MFEIFGGALPDEAVAIEKLTPQRHIAKLRFRDRSARNIPLWKASSIGAQVVKPRRSDNTRRIFLVAFYVLQQRAEFTKSRRQAVDA
ncbi:hypothetical protein PTKU64_85780 [Paraburkholderia terrae]|uniref:Uncharacterized protein n=1 Tax=Paraburkholderia terrae TaxID=311230 RepID=A0ABM7U0N9_9BURK|nr:hypothetical protein PTKU64_85780 [Paraburkholderia terrae]BDC44879.1 hypothetical protein PTKU15_81760 [Paraburkholderia terrae]